MLLVAVVLLTAWAIMALLEAAFLAVLGMVILVVATAPFWAKTRYALTDDGVEEHRLGRRKARVWSELRRVQAGPGAVLVSPFARPNWMDRYRGIVLYLDGADRTQVLAEVRARIPAPVPAAEVVA